MTITVLLSSLAVGLAAVESASIPFPDSGMTMGGSAGQVVALSSTSFLAGTSGIDSRDSTVNNVALLVTDLDKTEPTVTPLATPFLSDYSGHPARLSATRVVMFHGGPDGNWNTADDGIYVLDRLGSANSVTSVTIGFLVDLDTSAPTMLDESTVVLATSGPDAGFGTDDDTVALVRGIGETPTAVTHLAAPFLHRQGSGRPVALGPDAFLVVSVGPDGTAETGDEITYLFTDVGGGNTRTEIATPNFMGSAPGLPVALNRTRALVATNGDDGTGSTADDELLLLEGLSGTPTVTAIPVPNLGQGGEGRPVRVDGSTAILLTRGADAAATTADDSLVLLTGLGDTNTVTPIVVGFAADFGFQPSLLDPDTVAIQTGGPDGNFENADDEVVVVSDLRGTPVLTRHMLSGLDAGQSSQAVPLGPDAFLVSNAGPDGDLDAGEDDRFSVVTGATSGTPTVEHVDMDGENNTYWASQLPQYLGAGRAAVVSGGANQMITSGNDDVFEVLTGLPSLRNLVVQKATLNFQADKPEKGENATVKATLVTDGADPFAGLGVTISVGNAAQYIPASAFTFKKGTWKYKDPKGTNGWVRSLVFNTAKGTLVVKGKGVGTGMETTSAESIAVAVYGDGSSYGHTPAGAVVKKGLQFKAPK